MKSMRRSATKLLSPSSSQGDLSIALQEFRDANSVIRQLVDSQQSATEYLLRWSLKQENRAIRDSVAQLQQLMQLWSQAQLHFTQHVNGAMKNLENIIENQKSVDFAAKEVNALNDQQAKLKKGICRSPSRPWTKGGDVCLMEHRLKQAESAKAIALQKLQAAENEHEIVKMICIKSFLTKFSDSFMQMADSSTTIFEAQKDVAAQIPSINPGENIRKCSYSGAGITRRRVGEVRQKIQQRYGGAVSVDEGLGRTWPQFRQRRTPTAPPSCMLMWNEYEPPPPYSPYDPNGGPVELFPTTN